MEKRLTLRLFACLGLLATAFAAPASAQGLDESRITLSGAGGIAFPLHGDFDFNAPEWQIAVRATVSRHFLLEGFFDEWRKNSQQRFTRFESTTTYTMRTVGVNWLARGFIGGAAVTAGGGPGFLLYSRRFEEAIGDCSTTAGVPCQNFENRFSSQGFVVQGVAGVDVPITSIISGFGQFKFVMPIEDPGFSHTSIAGGVRVRVW